MDILGEKDITRDGLGWVEAKLKDLTRYCGTRMKAWSKGLFIAALAILATAIPLAAAHSSSASQSAPQSFTYVLGQGILCSLEEKACPDIAMSDNGDMVALNGTGTLSTHAKSVTGGGMFVHMDSSGHELVHGTWEAKDLLSFVSYGDATPQGLPANLFGGKAVIHVSLLVGGTVVHDGILTVYCVLGNPPHGAHEGVRLVVQDVINFNKQVSGDTVFVK